MHKYKYSIVIPVYRSGNTLAELFMQIKSVFDKITDEFEVVFVEDGGMDDSWSVISDLKERYPEFILAKRLERNTGQHRATVCGFELCQGDFVITIDDDLQIPPGEILKLISKQHQTGADLVYGTYQAQGRNIFIRAARDIATNILMAMYGVPNFGSSFRLIRGELLYQMSGNVSRQISFDAFLVWNANQVAFQNVEHRNGNNASRYSFYSLVFFAFNLIRDYFRLSASSRQEYGRIVSQKSISQ